jgi:electron transfer flavoprotein alpha subunit
MAANCVSAAAEADGGCRLVRQRWAGSLLEDATLDADVALLTVAVEAVAVPAAEEPAATSAAAPAAATSVHVVEPESDPADLRVCAAESATRGTGISLATARVVIGGGRGVGGPEGFAPLEELAGLLGAAVGVSRVVTSQGWRPHTQQVGQTGTRITPELYLACGISGAIQHMAGCMGAKHIVAINTDPGAPIISRAEYAVIGDLNEVIPALVAEIKKRHDQA